MQELDIATLKKRSIVGVVALTTRTFLLQIIAFASTFLLTLLLTPSTFGIFYVVSAVMSFLGYFSDIGLAAALVQKKEQLTREDLVTTFTVQQVLVVILVILSFAFSGFIARFYNLDDAGVWLFRALAISFFLSSLKTIPSILLERELKFDKLVIPTILETIGFYAVAVYLAWRGFGITSFAWGVLVRGVLGVVSIYLIRPWNMELGFSRPVLSKLLRFGVPFQVNSLLALFKDDLFTIYLGKALPFAEVGYIGWAKKWAEVPLRLIMDSIIRVTFPAFSRLQHDSKLLTKAIEKTVYGLALGMLPISVGLIFFIQPLVEIIPKYGKWMPAIPSFYFFVFAAAVAGMTTPLTNTLNAVGRIRTTLTFMIAWTVLTWVLSLLGISLFGFHGVSVALALISFTILFVIREVKKTASFSFVSQMWSAGAGVLVQAGWYVLILSLVPREFAWLLFAGITGVILYIGTVLAVDRKRIMDFASMLRGLS